MFLAEEDLRQVIVAFNGQIRLASNERSEERHGLGGLNSGVHWRVAP
jgi:hypothetical protein